jgi:ABC-type Fe3+-siderophore transport system permease subunit
MEHDKPSKRTEFFSRMGISAGAGLAAGLAVWLGGSGDVFSFFLIFGGGLAVGLIYGWLAVKEK